MRTVFRKILLIVSIFVAPAHLMAQEQQVVLCGEWITFFATSFEGFRFDHWSDGSTDSVRTFQVNESATFIAYFASTCKDYANFPIVSVYDWLLMLNVNDIKDSLGTSINFGPENVSWYKVIGEPDDLADGLSNDSLVVKGSYYLTLDKNLSGTGDYYAIIDFAASPSGELCHDYLRSVLVHYASSQSGRQAPSLRPNIAPAGQTIRLIGLDSEEQTDICVYDANGRRVGDYQSSGTSSFDLPTGNVQGCYLVLLDSPSGRYTLRFVLTR